MSTFRASSPIRPIIWAACHHCRRAMKMDALDPLIADRDHDTMFICTCGRKVRASYADPRGHRDVPDESWEIIERATARGPTF